VNFFKRNQWGDKKKKGTEKNRKDINRTRRGSKSELWQETKRPEGKMK